MRKITLLTIIILLFTLNFAMAKEMPDLGKSSVTIPWSDFKELLDKLEKTTPTVEPAPPVDYALGRGSLNGNLSNGILELTADYPLSILKSGWVDIPLVQSSSPIYDILIDGKTAPVTDNGGRITLIAKGPATHKLTIRFRVTAAMRPGPGSTSLELPNGAGQVLTLKLGQKLSGVTVDGATISHLKGAPLMAILTGDSLNIRYTVASEKSGVTQEVLPAKILVENNTLVSIDEGFIRAVVQLFYEVRHAPVNEFKVEVPKGFDVADCTGASLVGWKLDEESRVLTASVGFDVKGAYTLALVLEKSTKQESFAFMIPDVKALDVERERGFIAIQVTGGVEVTASGDIQGLQMVDSKELPAGLRSGATNPIVLSFKYLRHPFSANLKVVRHKTQEVLSAAIDSANYVVQVTLDGDCVSLADYTVRNNNQQFLKINLHKDVVLWSSFVAGKPVRPSKTKDGAILLPLEKSGYEENKLKSFNVEIIYYSNLGSNLSGMGSFNVQLPQVDLPIARSALTVFAPEKFSYVRAGGSMTEPYSGSRDGWFSGKDKDNGISALLMLDAPASSEGKSVKIGALKSRGKLANQQMEAEQVFQRRIRAANDAQDSTGALPARFSLPKQGVALRYMELVTILEPSTLKLRYISLKMISFLNYLLFFLTAGLAWFAKTILNKLTSKRASYGVFFGIVAAIYILVSFGCSIWAVVTGAIFGLAALGIRWIIRLIIRQMEKPKNSINV